MSALLRVVFIDELFKLIEFVASDFTKFYPERPLIDPPHTGFLDRQWGFEPRDQQAHPDHLPREYVQVTLKFCPSEREIERLTFDLV